MKKNATLTLLCIALFATIASAKISPIRLLCEYVEDPQVIDIRIPHLSWVNIAQNNERGQMQTAWEIRVSGTKAGLLKAQADLWDSRKVRSGESNNILYQGKPLTSRQDCWWQVRVWDKNGQVSAWSKPAFWRMGLLDQNEWKAQWIGAPWQGEEALPKPGFKKPGDTSAMPMPPPAPLLRKSVNIHKKIASARAFVTGLGYFEFYVNGKKVSKDVLVPNLTLYGKRPGLENNYISVPDNFSEYRVMYLAYDITALMKKGENVFGAILGNGFYNDPIRWTQSYGSPRFLGQIYITYTDGSIDVIKSDPTWKAAKSPVVSDLVYDGEHYDARMEQPGWAAAGFDDSKWEQALLRKTPEGKMKAQTSPVDRVMESHAPLKIVPLGSGKYRVDFGLQMAGWLHLLNVKGEAGRRIKIKYICESPVGDNSYTMKGGGSEGYAARFTWFVFREVEISNWPGELKPEQLRAEAVHTNVPQTGKFESSDTLFNKIHQIWVRSQMDNMHGGIASDCPHRERSPYTGDGQAACITVMHNFDSRAFYTKWIQDILGAQNPETGYVPNGAPWQPGCGGGVAWGAAISIMPWEFYMHYGDKEMLSRNYEGMKGYIKYMLTWTNDKGIMFSQAPDSAKANTWLNLGDWAAPGTLPPADMVHTFYLWRCADITSKTAAVLNNPIEAKKYAELADRTKKAFQHKFYNSQNGTYGPYGGNIFALEMGVPVEQEARVIAALKAGINAAGDHLDTGMFGTQFFFEVLARYGMQDLACKVMNQTTAPSYGWWIKQGATTTWEQWDGSGSHDHPMFGGGIVWFYRVLAGMNADPDQPGYRNLIFKPQPAGDVRFASYANETPFGMAAINWKKSDKVFTLNIRVPVGSTATVYVPAKDEKKVTESGIKIRNGNNIHFVRAENGFVVYTVGSGRYLFRAVS